MTTRTRSSVSLYERIRANRAEIALIIVLVIVSGVIHGWNMFHYPYYENDEATYISRGWNFIREGELDVYTYRYDHTPAGWMLIGVWLWVTGGELFFDTLLESGRTLMLVLHLASTVFVYVLAKRFSEGSRTAAIIAVTIFAAAPLGVFFQRRVLLDNVMVFWLLASIVLASRARPTIHHYIVSGVFFGLAVLSKLYAAFFGLGFLLLLWYRAAAHQRIHAIFNWLAFAGSTVMIFFIYAFLQQEFFEAPLGADGEPVRVSFLDTLALQAGRGGDFAWPWDPASSFYSTVVNSWLYRDSFTPALGMAALVVLTVVAFVRRKQTMYPMILVLFIWSFMLFLARGGIVLELYIAPLIPMLAIAVGMVVSWLLSLLPENAPNAENILRPALAGLLGGSLVACYVLLAPTTHLRVDETTNQTDALAWVSANVEPEAMVVADNYVYPELVQSKNFTNTEYFFPVEYDPSVRKKYSDDWRNFDYLLVTHEVIQQSQDGTIPNIRDALDHSVLEASFVENTTSYLDLPKYISTNGDWAQVYKVKSRNDIVLQDAWEHFESTFVREYGQVVDTSNGRVTTSHGQATGMLQAIQQDDESMFRGIWQWTKDHLRHRPFDALVSRLFQPTVDGFYEVTNGDTNCGADQQIMASLAQAADRWETSADLVPEAEAMVASWWRECIFTFEGRFYIDSSADGSEDDQLVNPSYFAPTTYRYLATKFPGYEWNKLIDDGYAFLDRLMVERGVIPTWVIVTTAGQLASAEALMGSGADQFGNDSLALLPHLVLEEHISGDPRSTPLIDALTPQVLEYAEKNPGMASGVGSVIVSQVRDTGMNAQELYRTVLYDSYQKNGSWNGGSMYFDHTWAWSWHWLQSQLPPDLQLDLE